MPQRIPDNLIKNSKIACNIPHCCILCVFATSTYYLLDVFDPVCL